MAQKVDTRVTYLRQILFSFAIKNSVKLSPKDIATG